MVKSSFWLLNVLSKFAISKEKYLACVYTCSWEGGIMYTVSQSLSPFAWEKNSLAEPKEIKASSNKMHYIYYF